MPLSDSLNAALQAILTSKVLESIVPGAPVIPGAFITLPAASPSFSLGQPRNPGSPNNADPFGAFRSGGGGSREFGGGDGAAPTSVPATDAPMPSGETPDGDNGPSPDAPEAARIAALDVLFALLPLAGDAAF